MPVTAPQADAERRYYAEEDLLCTAGNALADVSDPQERACLLNDMAGARHTQAALYTSAFRGDPDVAVDAETVRHEALLYRLLADVEHAVATGTPRQLTGTRLEEVAGDVLDRMAASSDLQRRARMLEPLYDAVGGTISGTAAEALWQLQSPGHVGWMTLAERASYNARHLDRFTRVAALVLLTPVAVCCVIAMAVATWRRRRQFAARG
jgi:hypothetical protein